MNSLVKREAVIRHVLASPYSSFYRNHFRSEIAHNLTEETWASMPLLSRTDITIIPFWKRVFAPRESVPVVRNTYGTTGAHTLVVPRSTYGDYKGIFGSPAPRIVMNFFASAHNHFPQLQIGSQTVYGDVKHLDGTVAIAECLRPDCIYLPPYAALIFGARLSPRIRNGIRLVLMTGERCSAPQYAELKRLYPHARVAMTYASSETREAVALSCERMQRQPSLIHEISSLFYVELVHPETGTLLSDDVAEGELVITTLETLVPFPLIRYRTGDLARRSACGCSQLFSYEVLGRVQAYPVKIARGQLTLPAVEQL
ncbi:MAG: hypothetical protein AAB923_02960, partial [Patescibacteria group bacterium]